MSKRIRLSESVAKYLIDCYIDDEERWGIVQDTEVQDFYLRLRELFGLTEKKYEFERIQKKGDAKDE